MTATLPAVAAARWQDAAVPEPQSDVALLARRGQGAQEAFAEVVRRHSGPLYAIGYRWLQSGPDAEEVVQDAFLLLWRKRGSVALVGGSALPWLIVTVKHLAQNRRRARARRVQYETAAGGEPHFAHLDEERTAVADLLRRAFAALPPLDAKIAHLCLVEDVTVAQAAARLGLTEGAVRNRLSRARARLRTDLRTDLGTDLRTDSEEER